MTIEEAIEYALSGQPVSTPTARLTRREAQIARLVARGATNREVATTLTISVRTAESHLDHVLSKLGLRNRTELGAWVRENLVEAP